MEFVEGVPIDQFVAEHRSTRAERLRLFLSVCEAVAYAHRNLVVHRDLKPANILVNRDGAPKLLDFGIAKVLTPDTRGQTVAALTPEYASPEQLLARNITTSTDIYSLGVLLFVLLADRLPHRSVEPRRSGPRHLRTGSGLAFRGSDRSRSAEHPESLHAQGAREALLVRGAAQRRSASLPGRAARVAARSGAFLYRAGKFMRRRAISLAASCGGMPARGGWDLLHHHAVA